MDVPPDQAVKSYQGREQLYYPIVKNDVYFRMRKRKKHVKRLDNEDRSPKIIIHQTADADEHFFKALTQLKVDVSPNMKNIDNDVLIHIPNDKKISEAGTEPLGLKPQASLSGVKRSAAEMAVDEHFKKSLAAFHANVASGHKPHYRPGDNMHHLIDRSSADDRFRSPDAMNQGPVVPKSLSATEREAIRRMASTKFKLNDEPPKLTPAPVAMEIDQFESMNLHKNASRNVSVSTSTDPMPGLDQMNLETYKKALEAFIAISKRNVHVFEDSFSPSATAGSNQSSSSTVSIEQSQCKVASPLAKESPTTSGNSFKPKKNWLAQYDVRQAPPDQLSSNLQAPTPGRSSSSTQCSDSTTSQDKQFSDEQMHANRSLLQSIMHHFAREMNDHTSTNTRPVDEKDPDSKKQILMIDLTENNEKSHSSDGSRFPKFIHSKEKTNINLDSSSIKLDVDQVRSDIALHSPKGNLPKSGDKRAEFNRSTLSDHGMNSNSLKSSIDLNSPLVTTGVSARPSKKTSLELQLPGTLAAERMNTQVNDCDYTEALGSTSANSRNSKVNSHWRFSGSSSPSPAYFEGSATAAVTPVSGATSGFFTGSTYSLDSPISQAPLFSFQSRDLCSGFDTKHASSNTEGKLPADAKTQAAATEDTLEGQSFAWSLRKRASSEISPWSTLKRSRSVLTSPILCKENCVSCNSSPREPTEAKDYSMNDLSPPNLVDSVGRPVVMAKSKSQQDTPEFTNKHLIKLLDQRSPPAGTYDGNTSTPPPRRSTGGLYHIDHKQKTGSEPPSLKSASNGLNSSRSLSDSSMVPKVGANWARKNEFFVLR